MPTDHPDGTFPVALIMADIMMPVDIQAQYVTLDVDITAQSIGNISIDIAAQTIGNLDVNIAASEVTINVAVTGTANIDITAQTVGIYLIPDWATKEGNSKVLHGGNIDVVRGSGATVNYTVPAGKTLYVNYLVAANWAYHSADGDSNQMCIALLAIDGAVKVYIGGNGGVGVPLTTPFRVDAGEELGATVQNWANHNTCVDVTVMGYEI